MKARITSLLLVLLTACGPRQLPPTEVADRRAACLAQGGFFNVLFNEDGKTVNKTWCVASSGGRK